MKRIISKILILTILTLIISYNISCEPKQDENMPQFDKCQVCGYIYDPEKGDPDSGIEPGTPFEELPEDWVCPECGVGKDEFEKVEILEKENTLLKERLTYQRTSWIKRLFKR